MKFLSWFGGIVLFIWLLGLIFKIGGIFIHLLLIFAVIVFIYDKFIGLKKK